MSLVHWFIMSFRINILSLNFLLRFCHAFGKKQNLTNMIYKKMSRSYRNACDKNTFFTKYDNTENDTVIL